MNKQRLILWLLLLVFFACKKDETHTNISSQADVYIAGFEYDGTHNYAVYWKNGQRVILGDGTKESTASSIYVSGNDVYVCGVVMNNMVPVATYWKNGTPIKLRDSAEATSIAISGNDVQVAGQSIPSHQAYYWKNGSTTSLPGIVDSEVTRATSLCISGSDVYIAGEGVTYTSTSIVYDALYWKNGNVVSIAEGPTPYAVHSIAITGNDIYILVGPWYWKNGSFLQLPSNAGAPNSIFIDGSDIYMGGNGVITPSANEPSRYFSMYWKNGVQRELAGQTGPSNFTSMSIFVFQNDVYVAGSKWGDGDSRAIYWKNGVLVDTVSSITSGARSIFIARNYTNQHITKQYEKATNGNLLRNTDLLLMQKR